MAYIGTVATGDFTMDYCRFGQGSDALVVLPGLSVQSVMGLADAIEEAYQVLTREFTVYVFDRRKDVPAGYSMRDMARDTEAAFDALGLGGACVFGASQGGMLAMLMAIERPELIAKLVLGSTAAQVSDEQFARIEGWIRLAGERRAKELYLAFGRALYPETVFEQARGALTEAARTVTEEDLERFMVLAESLRGFNLTDDLRKITCPVLVMGDTDDRLLGAEASAQLAELLGHVPGFACFLTEGYGHAAYDTAPGYKERMLHFFIG